MAKKNLTLDERLEEAIVKDGAYEVPRNWVWSRLGEICEKVQYGYTEKASTEKVGPHFLRITDIRENGVNWDTVPYCPISKKDYDKYKLNKGDIVIARTGATTGKNYIIDDEVDSVFASYLIRMKINKSIYNKFVSYYMYSDLYWKQIMEEQKGIAQPGVNAQKLGALIIPITPLKEQHRIVDRIESLFEKLDKAKELIEEAREGFEKRKSAVLEKAFRGELTIEWRKNNTIETFGLEYLSYISKKREEIYSCLVEESKKLGVKKPAKIHNADCYSETMENCETWIKTKLSNVVYDFRYGTSSKSEYTFEGKPVIRIPNLSRGYIIHKDMKYLKEDEVELNNKVNMGDILIVRSNGSQLLVGKTSIITESENDFAFASYLIRIRPTGIDSRFLYYMLNSISVKEQFYSKSKSTSGINNINTEELGNSIIVLPPLKEQKEIVRILDKLLEEESKIEELTQLEDQIELIKKSILEKAFRGELGTNCEEDGNALEFLKEILCK